MKKPVPFIVILGVLIHWFPAPLTAQLAGQEIQQAALPVIHQLDPGDRVFKQYLADVEAARRRVFNMNRTGDTPEALIRDLTIYAYRPVEKIDLFSLAARCNIPIAALATLNRLPHPPDFETAPLLLLPSIPGIFIPEAPGSDLEWLLYSARADREGVAFTLAGTGKEERFLFIPGADFSPTERTFFLTPGFRFPLRTYRLTSSFGPRINPVTGVFRVHQGLDLAAPEGTEVFAIQKGTITELGTNAVYGNYIIIEHGDGWVSLYGHLSRFETVLRNNVQSGTLIGRVGSTGQSTGPHLHFELRRNGKALDPGRLLFSK
jgi:murein DD-endopeptidase MepM/ murein hydrolase activator NlpD